MSVVSPISAVQARIQQIEQQFSIRRTGSSTGASNPAGSGLPNNVLGAREHDAAAAGSASPSDNATAAISSSFGVETPTLAGMSGDPVSIGGLSNGGTFDDVFAAAVQRLRVGWDTATVPTGSAPATVITDAAGITAAVGAPATSGQAGAGTTVGGASVVGAVDPSTPYAALFDAAGARHGIPPRVLAAVGYVESRFRLDAVSSAGAVGMMQFLPGTAASMAVDPHDPASAIDGAARYLRHGLDRFGSLEEAIAAYNVGPGTIARAGGVLPGTQAERYLTKVIEATGRV